MSKLRLENVLSGTKGEIVGLVRGGCATVGLISERLGLTANAVRAQIGYLQEDGILEQAGIQQGFRKPHHLFRLTKEAEAFFARAYEPVLSEVGSALSARMSSGELRMLYSDVGRRMAEPLLPDMPSTFEERLGRAVSQLTDLGSVATLEETDSSVKIVGSACPLGSAVAKCPEVCSVVKSFLEKATGGQVTEHCIHGDEPACRFVVERS